MSRRLGDWYVFCDICGRRCFASETTKLSTHTGRGNLIVCKFDADKIDPGLVPFKFPIEKNVTWTRINHTNESNGSPIVDLETMSYEFYLAASQDNAILTPSQNTNELLVAREPV